MKRYQAFAVIGFIVIQILGINSLITSYVQKSSTVLGQSITAELAACTAKWGSEAEPCVYVVVPNL